MKWSPPSWWASGDEVTRDEAILRPDMIPHIPDQRKFRSNTAKPFNDLIKYLEGAKEKTRGLGPTEQEAPRQQERSSLFDDILDYATASTDKETNAEKCIAIRTHGVTCFETASIEMNAVAKKNTRCKDPAYHVILSWPEHEKPAPEKIFDAAEHALRALGLGDHQYVIAVHGNTDNMHCHISVNRVHPVTFKARHIEWAVKTLHYAARESEIKHGWSHDNGIYVVQTNGHGKKQIVLNKEFGQSLDAAVPRVHRELGGEETLPSWHDPESLDSWLKKRVSKDLKHALPDLQNWQGLHAWLDRYGIELTDSGGGGLRLHVTSRDTGEILDIAASKGLRLLKRPDLEKRWGPFRQVVENTVNVPDLSHLTPQQISEGVEDVINTIEEGTVPEHILRAQSGERRDVSERGRGVHEMPDSGLDRGGQDGVLPLPGSIPGGVGDDEAGQDTDVRRSGTNPAGGRSEGSSRWGLARDNSQRDERKAQRAAARADLRQRFAQYRRFVQEGDTDHFQRLKEIQGVRKLALKELRESAKAARSAIPKSTAIETKFLTVVAIDAEAVRRKLQIEADYQEQAQALRAIRVPPLSWRTWLHEQSQLGDQAALSALRGIVYQAQRDAKKAGHSDLEEPEFDDGSAASREREYRKLMKRLLDEEKQEVAIRAAVSAQARPFEADVLLARYRDIQWRVTGNGNVEYSDRSGHHLFTDRGNRVTFDRAYVTDDELRLALAHAQQKFRGHVTLTGDDLVFVQRMARLADDMGIGVINPELQAVIAQHRSDRASALRKAVAAQVSASPAQTEVDEKGAVAQQAPEKPLGGEGDRVAATELVLDEAPALTANERLRAMVLAIDPGAKFVTPDPTKTSEQFLGPVAAQLDGSEACFAQHVGRSVYALHTLAVPEHEAEQRLSVRYQQGVARITVEQAKGRDGR